MKESLYYAKLNNGLTVTLLPKTDFNEAYGVLTTEFGALHTQFKADGKEIVHYPAGIAHFLEHKLFESEEDGDVMNQFAKLGASANAYTGFRQTSYLFSTTQEVLSCLKLLQSFVTKPHFTKENVEREQGIIEQEIEMYEGLKKGEIANVSRGFEDLSCGIIESRIAKGYNQKQFAELLKTSEQQVQKYESENYSNISLKRLQEIVAVLDVDVDATFKFHKKRRFAASDFLAPQGINTIEIRNRIRSRGTTVSMCR